MKYVDCKVTFAEVPEEISLCITISGCTIHCPGCHSQYLWQDIGEELTSSKLIELIKQNTGISCVCLMGGDAPEILQLILSAKIECSYVKWAWYTGEITVPQSLLDELDYVKVGPYRDDKGPLTSNTTNQHFLKKIDGKWFDITSIFHRD